MRINCIKSQSIAFEVRVMSKIYQIVEWIQICIQLLLSVFSELIFQIDFEDLTCITVSEQ